MNTTECWRLFVALPAPGPILERIESVQRRLGQRLPPRTVRWTRPDQLHLTLRFLGGVACDAVEALAAALRSAALGTGPLPLALDRLGCFPNPARPRVLWVGLAGDLDRLAALQTRVATTTAPFGDHAEVRPFRPHLTLGRIAASGVRLPNDWPGVPDPIDSAGWIAEHFLLVRSQLEAAGVRYSILATVPLTDPAVSA